MVFRCWWLAGLLAGLLAAPAPGVVRAGEGEPEGEAGAERPKKKRRPREGGEFFRRIKEIHRKQKAGEELTGEEKALLEKFKAQRGKRQGRRPQRIGLTEGLAAVNAVDAVKLSLALGQLAKGQAGEAVEVLGGVIKSSPDEAAVGYAHLFLAHIHMQKGDKEAAEAELKKVKGPAVLAALAMLLAGGGDPTAKLEKLLETAEDPLAKALIIRRLAEAYRQAGNLEKLAALAERAAKLLSYKDALAALEAESKMPRGRGGRPPREGRGGRERMMKQMKARMGALKKEIKELEAAGKKEEADRLRRRLEHMEKMAERGGREGRGGRGDRKKRPEPAPPADQDIF